MAKSVLNKNERERVRKTRNILRSEYIKEKSGFNTYQRLITLNNGHVLSFIYYEGVNTYGSFSLKIVDMDGKIIKQERCNSTK